MNGTPSAPPQKKKLGCWFYGCLTLVIVVLLGGLGVFLTARYALKKVQAMVAEYTETSPLTLPEVKLAPDHQAALDKRLQVFKDALDGKGTSPPLVLSSDEINALLTKEPAFKGRVHVAIEADRIKGQVSIPMELVPFIGTKGRYLNGAATFTAGLTNGMLWVTVQSLEVKGKPLPEEFMKGLRGQNLAQNAADDPNNAEVISKLESLDVKDGLLTIRAKEAAAPSETK